jgi:hypothetical protein
LDQIEPVVDRFGGAAFAAFMVEPEDGMTQGFTFEARQAW